MSERIPAEVFSLAECLCDEMEERGWTTKDVAAYMGDTQSLPINLLTFEMVLAVPNEPGATIDDETFAGMARAFGVSEQFLRNIDRDWRAHPEKQQPFTAPEHLFSGAHLSPLSQPFRSAP